MAMTRGRNAYRSNSAQKVDPGEELKILLTHKRFRRSSVRERGDGPGIPSPTVPTTGSVDVKHLEEETEGRALS